ncbi:MAG: hypothetical protein IJG40_01430 [Oscillospiraceae bacterium]|nr:hypothetical protein [Oscillospiraceae bacterium]
MRFLALILSALLLSACLTGCGMQEPAAPAVSEEPEPTPAPVIAYEADVAKIGAGLSVLTPLCAVDGGFYCASYEKTGEDIPEAVVQEAKRKKTEVYNDGRYDVYGTGLCFLADDGTLEPLEEYTGLAPEENAENWKEFACLTVIEKLCPDKDGDIITLEYNIVSGNSTPPNRADRVIGKNYLEYHTLWYVRTLGADGAELKSESFGENAEKASARFRSLTRKGNMQVQIAPEEVPFSWEGVGISRSSVLSDIKVREDGSYCFVTGSSEGADAVAAITLREQKEEKIRLLLAAPVESSLLAEAIDTFHASQKNCCISVIPFSEEDAVPEADLYLLSASQLDRLGREGLLADLYPYLDAEKRLGRDDFFPSVLRALERDGALLSTGAGMSFDTVIGASSLVGEETSWSYEEFLSAWSDLGLGTDAFEAYMTCEDILSACLRLDLDTFVDRDTGSCSFSGENFMKLLYFTGNFRRSYDFGSHAWSDADNSDLRIRNGKQMLLEKHLTGFRDAILCGYEFSEDITFVGYPTLGEAGSRMTVSTLETGYNLSMGASSQHKDAAWSFLRAFFTEKYQKDYWYFPTNIHVFNRQLNDAMKTEPLLDQWGNPVVNRQTGEPAIKSVGTVYLSNYVEINLYPLTENEAEKLVSLVTEGAKSCIPDEALISLILQNVSGYYAGTQSLEEAAVQVQQAAEIYLAPPALPAEAES